MSDENPTPPSASAADEKAQHAEQIESIVAHDSVPGHSYYEKNGLRTYGDGEDHDHEPPVCSMSAICEPWLTRFAAFLPEIDVFDRNGFSLDWIADSCLYIWSVNFSIYSLQLVG